MTEIERELEKREATLGTCPDCETEGALRFMRGMHLTDGNATCLVCGYWNWGNGSHKPKAHEIKMERIAKRIEAAADRVERALSVSLGDHRP